MVRPASSDDNEIDRLRYLLTDEDNIIVAGFNVPTDEVVDLASTALSRLSSRLKTLTKY